MRIHPVTAELSHAEGRKDTTKLTVAFCNFAEAPKNCQRPFSLNLSNVQHSLTQFVTTRYLSSLSSRTFLRLFFPSLVNVWNAVLKPIVQYFSILS